jgi:hypothetical protein
MCIVTPYCCTGLSVLLERGRCDLPKVPDKDITPVRIRRHYVRLDTL